MKEQDVIEEMIEFLFLKKRRDRMRYILSKENRKGLIFLKAIQQNILTNR